MKIEDPKKEIDIPNTRRIGVLPVQKDET